MELKNHFAEIIAIACENNVSWDIGMDMFVNNMEDAEAVGDKYFYHGADDTDYKALKAEWDKLTPEDKAKAKNEFCDWYRANKINK